MTWTSEHGIQDLVAIAKAVGNRPDYVQGGGGNISVKLDESTMAIKASGYRIDQITKQSGHVLVDYKGISQQISKGIEPNVNANGPNNAGALRPSVEAGFHSLLRKYVIHTHSVYANILGCSEEGGTLLSGLFSCEDFAYAFLNYTDPGHELALTICELLRKSSTYPSVLFMRNHGLVVTSDDMDECIALHEKINSRISDCLQLHGTYPAVELKMLDDRKYASESPSVKDAPRRGEDIANILRLYPLYPDQLVYLNMNLSKGKIRLDRQTGTIYVTTYQDARNIEETLVGYLYVIHTIQNRAMTIHTMKQKDVDFILNWESEKYRQNINP